TQKVTVIRGKFKRNISYGKHKEAVKYIPIEDSQIIQEWEFIVG
ncbi:17338_t:CDS:1, partial [Dentiscutata erythropus]